MAIPEIDTLLPIVDQPKISAVDFIAALTTVMSDPEAVKYNYRGNGVFSFYVPGRMRQSQAEIAAKELKDAGYQVNQIAGQTGYMPAPWLHDFTTACHDTPEVTGYPQYEWTHVQLSKLKTDVE